MKMTTENKMTIQLCIAVGMCVCGMVLLFLGFFFSPQGEIHSSVLIAFGEVQTFVGALLGVDYHYRYKQNEGRE